MTTTGADLIAEILKREGVEYIPAFPHSDIIDAGAKLGIRPIIVRQERHALHIADGFARMTGGRHVCCTTVQYGPGSENAYGAVAQCFADNVPVLHIPGGYATGDQGVSPNFNAARNMQNVNKWCEMVYRTERIPQMMQNAFAQLRNGRPGPVTLEVPIDIFTAEADPALLDSYVSLRRSAPCASSEDIQFLADTLMSAKEPVIVAGQGILYAEAWDELLALAELTGTPVMSTLNGKSCFPENHPLALGCAGGSRPDMVNRYLEKADLLLGLGTSFTRSDYITPFPTKGKRLIQLTNHEGDIGKDYPIEAAVIGDAKPTLSALVSLLTERLGSDGRPRPETEADIAAIKSAFQKKWMAHFMSDEKPISPYRVLMALGMAVDLEKTVVTHEAGSPRDQFTAFWEARVPHGYMGWGKTTQLGMSLGLMHGAKLAKPDWTCINIMGDAAIGMTGMDFETGVRNNIGTLTVILKNSVMGGYTKYHPNAAEKYQIEALGGNYADFAKAMGGHGERVSDPADLAGAIGRALESTQKGVPALLEVITKEESEIPRDLPAGL